MRKLKLKEVKQLGPVPSQTEVKPRLQPGSLSSKSMGFY
jgi:hypothetical protein